VERWKSQISGCRSRRIRQSKLLLYQAMRILINYLTTSLFKLSVKYLLILSYKTDVMK
jgi:Txe/YoeB family toxin of Txe-Axe toxin-antitoxin module